MRVILLIFAVCIPTAINASTVVATFSGQLVRVDDQLLPQFNVGDPFSYSITYDNESSNVSGTPDYSKFPTGPFVIDVNGYSVGQSESFIWNGFIPTSGGVDPDWISFYNEFSPISGAPIIAAGPLLNPGRSGFRWKTTATDVSADLPPANLSSDDFKAQGGAFTFAEQRGSVALGVEVAFSSGQFTNNPDGSISINFTGEVVGKNELTSVDNYDFRSPDFQPGTPFTLTALIGAGQADLNPVDGEGRFLAENAVFTSGSYSAAIQDLEVTTFLDFDDELEIRLNSLSQVVASPVETLTTALPTEIFASINDDQLDGIFDFSKPLVPFNIGDVDVAGFGVGFLGNAGGENCRSRRCRSLRNDNAGSHTCRTSNVFTWSCSVACRD